MTGITHTWEQMDQALSQEMRDLSKEARRIGTTDGHSALLLKAELEDRADALSDARKALKGYQRLFQGMSLAGTIPFEVAPEGDTDA